MSTTTSTPADPLLVINNLVHELDSKFREIAQRRSDMRYPLNKRLTLGRRRPAGGFVPICEAYGLDLSYQGIGMLTCRDLLPGIQLQIDMSGASGIACVVPVTVVYRMQLLPNVFRIGARFDFE